MKGNVMSKQKTGFTMEEHRAAGEKLRRMQGELTTLYIDVANHYTITGKRSKRVLVKMKAMQSALNTVRSELEELMAEQYPKEWTTKVYYGGGEEKE
jgi:hypothetical protein